MDLNLKDKVVIVTGGSKGIGYAISHVIAAEGGIPFVVSRNEKSILETVKEISEKGGKCSFAVAELTDPDQCKASVKKAISEFGTIHGLVNNAGVNDSIGLENGDEDTFILSLKKNVVHTFKEKPQVGTGWINGGFFVAKQSFISYIKDDKTILEKSPLERAAKQKELYAFKHYGFWKCMDTKRDKDILENILKKKKS